MAKSWTIEPGAYGSRIVIRGSWSTDALQTIEKDGIREIELNYAKGWSGTEYSFLRKLPNLDVLEITDWNADDIAAVNDLTSLRRLKVFTHCKTEIRFSRFPLLEECSLEWRPKARSLVEHDRIKKVFINKYPGKNLTALERMTGLESLSLASPKIETLAGIGALKGLAFLGVYVARRLTTLAGVELLQNLAQLEVNDCPKLSTISPVARLRRLQRLHLCNDGEVTTLLPLHDLKNLEEVLFYESTNVVDGDLSVLKALPKLRRVEFMDRPHYSHRRSDFPRLTVRADVG